MKALLFLLAAYVFGKIYLTIIFFNPGSVSETLTFWAYVIPVMLIIQTIYHKVYGPDIEKKKRLDKIRKEL